MDILLHLNIEEADSIEMLLGKSARLVEDRLLTMQLACQTWQSASSLINLKNKDYFDQTESLCVFLGIHSAHRRRNKVFKQFARQNIYMLQHLNTHNQTNGMHAAEDHDGEKVLPSVKEEEEAEIIEEAPKKRGRQTRFFFVSVTLQFLLSQKRQPRS